MKIISLDIETAIGILEALGCEDDPITWKKKDIVPRDLEYHYTANTNASSIKITFYSPKRGDVKGSLYSMVVDRLTIKY